MTTSSLRDRVLPEFAERTRPLDSTVAMRCAKLHVPEPRPERDTHVAATSIAHGITVVTRNVADYAPYGLRVTIRGKHRPALNGRPYRPA